MASLSKTHVDFWKRRLRKPRFTRNGIREQSANWSATFQFAGVRREWSLGTPNKEAAAQKARDIYLWLVARGWDATIAQYRPRGASTTGPMEVNAVTVGEFLAEAKARADCDPATVEFYAKALRKIVSDIKGFRATPERFDPRHGRGEWLARVHAVPLSEITPGEVQGWKRAFVARAQGQGPLKERSARTSVNSFLAQARSLFSPKHTRHFSFPVSSPFEGVKFEPRPSPRYQSGFDVQELIAKALAELEPELLKIFLLAVMAGLRRKEIDLLEWNAMRWDEGVIRIGPTAHFEPKSEYSIGDVQVDPEVLEVFRGFRAKALGEFVIHAPPKRKRSFPHRRSFAQHYRCEAELERLTAWLRANGVKAHKPLHTLRKEFGSLVCKEHGIHAASTALRHGSLKISADYYVEPRGRATSGLGHLLKPAQNVIDLERESANSAMP
jgi:integrase